VLNIVIPPVVGDTKAAGPVYNNVINLMVPPHADGLDYYGPYGARYRSDWPDVFYLGGPFALLVLFLCCYVAAVACCLAPVDDYYYPRGAVIPYRLVPAPPEDPRDRYAHRV
jgi:hypothetical protein